MDSLAPEILHDIYALACTDGGFTGCSLSQVSKHTRSASRPARFQSVAISGTARRLAEFICLLDKERAIAEADGHRLVVKHLSFTAEDGREVQGEWLGIFSDRQQSCGCDMEDPALMAVVAEIETYQQDVSTLFRLVARDLQTLVFVDSHGWATLSCGVSDSGSVGDFPLLRELTVLGGAYIGVVPSIRHPSLTHLHLDFSDSSSSALLPLWAAHAPRVTHLCLSEIDEINEELKEIAASGSPFKKLNRLYVQPEPGPASSRGFWHANLEIERAVFMLDFKEIPNNAVISTHALPHRESPVEDWTRQIWLERIGGGFGCWIPFEPKMEVHTEVMDMETKDTHNLHQTTREMDLN